VAEGASPLSHRVTCRIAGLHVELGAGNGFFPNRAESVGILANINLPATAVFRLAPTWRALPWQDIPCGMAPPHETLKDAHWQYFQALVWVAYRDVDRVREERKEWGERNPRRHPPIWSWRGWTPEIAEASRVLLQMLQKGTVRASRRKARGGPRRPIDPLEWCDVELVSIDPPRLVGQEAPQFYDRDTPDRDFAAATAEPWRDVLISVADLLRAFPAVNPSPLAISEMTAEIPHYDLVAFYREQFGTPGTATNREDMDRAAKEHFGRPIPIKARRAARNDAGVKGKVGRPRKSGN